MATPNAERRPADRRAERDGATPNAAQDSQHQPAPSREPAVSPVDAFGTVHELAFTAGFNDSENGFAVSPAVTLAFELGDNTADGRRQNNQQEKKSSSHFRLHASVTAAGRLLTPVPNLN